MEAKKQSKTPGPTPKATNTIIEEIERSLVRGEAQLSHKELAERTGYSHSSVKRAVAHMRQHLSDLWEIESGKQKKDSYQPEFTTYRKKKTPQPLPEAVG